MRANKVGLGIVYICPFNSQGHKFSDLKEADEITSQKREKESLPCQRNSLNLFRKSYHFRLTFSYVNLKSRRLSILEKKYKSLDVNRVLPTKEKIRIRESEGKENKEEHIKGRRDGEMNLIVFVLRFRLWQRKFQTMRSEECLHEYITPEGTCSQCGMTYLKLFSSDVETVTLASTLKSPERSIAKDLEDIPVPEEVKTRAERIYTQLNSHTKRGNKRKQMVFFCLYNAFNEMGQPQDPKKIASMVGIKLSEMTKALSMFSEAQTGYRLPNVFVTPLDFIPQYCESLQLNSEMTEDILRFAEGILKKEPELNEKFPQKVAAGILQYYLIIHGIQINRKEYAKIVSLSEVTINNIYKHIARIHNL